jgi:hypothetical protein
MFLFSHIPFLVILYNLSFQFVYIYQNILIRILNDIFDFNRNILVEYKG